MKRDDLKITMGGNPISILGSKLNIGDKAPNFTVIDSKLQEVKLSSFAGKKVIIAVYPSIDTAVCAMQNRKFNAEVNNLENTVVLSISVDLPFAQARFCGAEGLDNIHTLSDHRSLDFGMKYGFVIDGLRLLARGTVIINEAGMLEYIEHVPEVTTEPDYEKAMSFVK